MPEYLFDLRHQIFDRINEANKVLLFLDYDGTLVSFKDRPQDVITPYAVKTSITQLCQNQRYIVLIVTGRTLHEITQLLDIDGLSFAALHGLEIKLPTGKSYRWEPKDDIRSILVQIKEHMKDEFIDEKGVYLEDKELTLALHYRMLVEEKIQDIVGRFLEIIKTVDSSNSLDIIHGAKVVEVKPTGWNKGKAVELLTTKLASKKTLPIYIGDDTTDEDAFTSIGNNGITIFVSNNTHRQTAAQYWLKNPDDVLSLLRLFQTR